MADTDTNYVSTTWGSSTSADGNWTVNSDKFNEDLSKLYGEYKKTKKKVNSGRKRMTCNRCGEKYYLDEGIDGGYCSLDCKYSSCIIEEETDGKSL